MGEEVLEIDEGNVKLGSFEARLLIVRPNELAWDSGLEVKH